jgi:hypothetical protein
MSLGSKSSAPRAISKHGTRAFWSLTRPTAFADLTERTSSRIHGQTFVGGTIGSGAVSATHGSESPSPSKSKSAPHRAQSSRERDVAMTVDRTPAVGEGRE